MRIEANMTSNFDGKLIKIKWKNDRIIKEINKHRDWLIEENDSIDKAERNEEITANEAEEQRQDLLAEFYQKQSDAMFEFEKGLPEKEWFARDDFPVGQFEFLRQVFTNPQIQT